MKLSMKALKAETSLTRLVQRDLGLCRGIIAERSLGHSAHNLNSMQHAHASAS